ncbi:MAG: hypothetical protein HWD61_10840 [Parachlamydiaceae bacterium]|nr:MAG: hypothetical protein HWD61_10840 [Parachlamydiaceae bacterium]
MKFKVDGDLPDHLLKIATEKEHKLQTIQFLEFYDLYKTHNEPGLVDVKFISKGSVMSKGVMRMSTNESGETEGAIERFICLPGFPKPIKTTDKSNAPECDEKKQTDFELRLAALTQQEISDKQVQNKEVQ